MTAKVIGQEYELNLEAFDSRSISTDIIQYPEINIAYIEIKDCAKSIS